MKTGVDCFMDAHYSKISWIPKLKLPMGESELAKWLVSNKSENIKQVNRLMILSKI